MTEPTDKTLYDKVVAEVNKSYKKPSAYRSMGYTKYYQKAFEEKYGDKKAAYKGKNPGELKTWRKEKWVDVKSVLRDPKNPTACGNEPIAKGEYPLCMKEKELGKYSKGELGLLVKRKNEIGKKRLVKDAFLRDVLEPEKTPQTRIYKQKYVKDKKMKIPEAVPEKEAAKILREAPIRRVREKTQKVTVPTFETEGDAVVKPSAKRGRPKLSAEQLAANKQATLERRKVARQTIKEQNAASRQEQKANRNAQKEQARLEKEANRPQREMKIRDNEPLNSPYNLAVYEYKRNKELARQG
jgi:hypothetical protein